MKAEFLINPSLRSGAQLGGVETVQTDLLMLTKLSGLGLGPSPQAVDTQLAGRLSEKMRQKRFKGTLGEHLTLQCGPEHPARNVLLVGLGSPATFDYCALKEVMGVAVSRAIKLGCTRISLEIAKDRLTAARANLRGTAAAIRDCIEEKLAEIGEDKPGTLEIELICTPQAARHLRDGLSVEPRAKRVCCEPKHSKVPSGAGKKKA